MLVIICLSSAAARKPLPSLSNTLKDSRISPSSPKTNTNVEIAKYIFFQCVKIVGNRKISLPPPLFVFLDIIERNVFKSKVPEPPSTSLMFCLISASAHKILFCFATKKFLIPCNNFYNNYDLHVTIMCRNDELSSTMN